MAKSQYEYVKEFELSDQLLPGCWLMCRLDGIGFTKFTYGHHLVKPNDSRMRDLMNLAARTVMAEYTDICIAYGVSDEYSFVLQPQTVLYNRRASKIGSAIVSLFTSAFFANWNTFFPQSPIELTNLPSFDSRVVCYPTDVSIKDYLRWRQVDCHINNLYNTCFWKLVRRYQQQNPDWTEKHARDQAHAEMNSKYASSGAKNDLLHDEFGLNYNDESEADRKGSILVWKEVTTSPAQESTAASAPTIISPPHPSSLTSSATPITTTPTSTATSTPLPSSATTSTSSSTVPTIATAAASSNHTPGTKLKRTIVILHCDLIQESFYTTVCPGIIPYLSWADLKKLSKSADKAVKKAAYKERAKQEKDQSMQLQPTPARVELAPNNESDSNSNQALHE